MTYEAIAPRFMIKSKFISLFSAVVGITLAVAVGCSTLESNTSSVTPERNLECIAPAKPGGGFDLTCRLLANSLATARLIEQPMRIDYMPGGIGAQAYTHIVTSQPDDPSVAIAASTGSAVNLAQGKFGQYDVSAVRWLAALGSDYGAIAVRADAPWQNLGELMESFQNDPESITVGAGGSIGSQDWFKAALMARAVGVEPQKMRYVAFEGGGESIAALLGGQIQVYPGDASELKEQVKANKIRVLATLSDERLPGFWQDYPTAKEQNYDSVWQIWRGYYLPPEITQQQYDWWVSRIEDLVEREEFQQELARQGLFRFVKIGSEYDAFVKEQVTKYKKLAAEANLI